MNRITIPTIVLLLAGLVCIGSALAQTEAPQPTKLPKPSNPVPVDGETAEQAKPAVPVRSIKQVDEAGGAVRSPTPGQSSEHKLLAQLAGDYKVAVTIHGFGDAGPPATKGRVKFESILGGRFLMETSKSQLLGDGFEWVGIYGYDSSAKKYTAIWADNGRDTHDTAFGTYDATTQTLIFTGEQDDPRTGGKKSFKWTIRMHPPDDITIEMYEKGADGEEQLVMRLAGVKD